MLRSTLILFFILIPVHHLSAAPAINCHCFQDRAYDPQTPERVTPYLLATTRNSFLAAAFKLPRKQVVRERMTGTSATELWLAYYLGSESGEPVAALRKERRSQTSWHALYRKYLPNHPLLAAGRSDQQLSAAVVDTLVARHLTTTPLRVAQLRAAGATDPELILSLLLARWTGRVATGILADVVSGKTSWGQELNATGRQPQELAEVISQILRSR